MIHTDGKLTIANHGWESDAVFHDALTERNAARRPTASERIRQARALREAALDAPNRGPQDNGIEWNDGYCNCGVAICDSPAGDKCWDCFNHEPGE